MIRVPLTQDLVALIDEEDWCLISKYKWHAAQTNTTNLYYARTALKPNNDLISMHRLLLNAKPSDICGHRDGNGLNNTRKNIRITTRSINSINIHNKCRNASGYRGVTKSDGRFMARIRKDKVVYYLGLFKSPIEASIAWERKALELYGEDAPTSKIEHRARSKYDLTDLRRTIGLSL